MIANASKFIMDLRRPVMISMENFSYLVDSKCVSDDGKDWTITLMEYDTMSRNRSVYGKQDVLRSLQESTYVQENMQQRTWFAELEHPAKGADLDRFMYVEPTRYAWNILKYWDAGDVLKGQVHLCPPLGTSIVLPNVKELGSNYAASVRFYTPNFIEKNDENGQKYFVKQYKMYPVTFDCVSTPGLRKSRIIDPDHYNPGEYKPGESSKESIPASCDQVLFDNPAEQFKHMIMAEESSKILEDYFGFDMKSAKAFLTKNDRIELSTEDGLSMSVPLNQYITGQILG
jgi:hypothetical protein